MNAKIRQANAGQVASSTIQQPHCRLIFCMQRAHVQHPTIRPVRADDEFPLRTTVGARLRAVSTRCAPRASRLIAPGICR